MNTIFKYALNPNDLNLKMPVGAKILSAHNQNNQICIWAEVDTSAELELVGFEILGTGHEIVINENNREFIGTVLIHDGELVFHVYKLV